MISLQVSNYSGSYTHINNLTSIKASPFDLARCIVTVGQGSWMDTAELGIFRIGELICKALAFSKADAGKLILQERFHSLNQSEKATISYYFGQGLTKLYAEQSLRVKWLFHIDDFENEIEFHIRGIASSKLIVGNTKKTAQRPDLIGIEYANNCHIFEAKGNSSCYDVSVMQHAINQVSQIKEYKGGVPLTRTACYFDLSKNPINGIIIDPENDGNGISILFNEEAAIKKYYTFFLENKEIFTNRYEYNGYKFLTTPVGIPQIHFGFDERLLKLSPLEILNGGLMYDMPSSKLSSNDEELDVSLGLDGIILFNRI